MNPTNEGSDPMATTGTLPTDWWAVADVLRYLESVGCPVTSATWYAYVHGGQPPKPDRLFGRAPAWKPTTIQNWQAGRPRRGARQ
ncbi:hypothetical protein GCM10009556_104790 [Acrocarpospora pleiomorpha]